MGCQTTKYKIPLATASPKDTVTQIFAEKFVERVAQLSNHKIEIEVYPNSVLGGDRELMESCYDGDIPFVVGNSAPQVSFIPAAAIFDAPCVYNNIQDVRKIIDNKDFSNLMTQAYYSSGFRLLGYADQGFRVMSTNKKVINEQDFKSQKIRTMENPNQLNFWQNLGANPTPMNFSEVYIGLSQHTIDAQENPYEIIVANRLYEMQDYVIETNHLPHLISLIASNKYFEKLSTNDQEIIIQSAKEAKDYARMMADQRNLEKIEIIKQNGTEVITPSSELYKYMQLKAKPIYENIKKQVDSKIFDLYIH